MKKLCLLLVSFACVPLLAQQKVDIQFDETDYNFGSVHEEAGPISHVFKFVNTGLSSFFIQSVQSSCGCTTPEWSQQNIAPQDSGYVKVTFDPYDRAGRFHKGVRVTLASESGNITEMLDIEGFVLAREERLEDKYPYHFGQVYLRSTIISFDTLYKGDATERTFELVNGTDESLSLKLNLPKYIKADLLDTLGPNEKIVASLQYESSKSDSWGYSMDDVALLVDGKKVGDLHTQVVLTEDFSHLTHEERLAAPVASLQEREVGFGDLKIGKTYKRKITLYNFGTNDLRVRALTSGSDYLHAKSKSIVKGGKSTKITIEVDATHLEPYNFTKTIQLITNDPTNPVQTITVTWQTVD